MIDLNLPDSEATDALGAAMARAFTTGGAGAVLYLQGDLGTGKTTCARSLLRSLGVVGLIRSPTYTLVEVYKLAATTCVHVDLYRIHSAGEVDELGLRDFLGGDCLLLVEWPEKGGGLLPAADLHLTLSYAGNSRLCAVTAHSLRGEAWLADLEQGGSLSAYVSNLT